MYRFEKELHMQSHAEGRFKVRQCHKKAGRLAESCEPGREASSSSARFLEGTSTVAWQRQQVRLLVIPFFCVAERCAQIHNLSGIVAPMGFCLPAIYRWAEHSLQVKLRYLQIGANLPLEKFAASCAWGRSKLFMKTFNCPISGSTSSLAKLSPSFVRELFMLLCCKEV